MDSALQYRCRLTTPARRELSTKNETTNRPKIGRGSKLNRCLNDVRPTAPNSPPPQLPNNAHATTLAASGVMTWFQLLVAGLEMALPI
jgi:hypothetical protein